MVRDLEVEDDGPTFLWIKFTSPAGHEVSYYDLTKEYSDRLDLYLFLKGFCEWLEKHPDLDDKSRNVYDMIVQHKEREGR